MKNKAFTLTELIAVIIIIGVILLFLIPSARRILSGNKEDKYKAFVAQVENAVKTYADTEFGDTVSSNSVSITSLISNKYLTQLPDVDDEAEAVINDKTISFTKNNGEVVIDEIKITFKKNGNNYCCTSEKCASGEC